jgi:hypothetical protein
MVRRAFDISGSRHILQHNYGYIVAAAIVIAVKNTGNEAGVFIHEPRVIVTAPPARQTVTVQNQQRPRWESEFEFLQTAHHVPQRPAV